jgi:hypothetical protein
LRRVLVLGAVFFALSAGPAYGSSVNGDFDGDGLADLAIGVLYEDVGAVENAGGVNVIYGAPHGLGASARNQFFTQSNSGGGETAEANDQFGFSLAAGDFNGDGFSDLAIGVPNEDFTTNPPPPILPTTYTDLGVAHVIYGSANGLDPLAVGNEADLFSTEPASYQSFQEFGFALAAANFGNGAPVDLAVGSPGDDLGALGNGSVAIFYGHTSGIDLASTAVFGQATEGVAGEPNDGESFGKALAAGNFGKGPRADIAVGAPNDVVQGVSNAGGVNVLYGSAVGIRAAGSQRWTQDSRGIAGRAEGTEGFGASLGAGDVGKSGHADLAVGAPCETIGPVLCAGGVNLIYGTSHGLSSQGDQYWSQATPGIRERPASAEGFGLSLTVANFGRSGRADLAIASDEKVGSVSYAGAVQILYGTDHGLTADGDQLFSQATAGIEDRPAQADGFGRALAAGNFGRGQYADLAVGIPNEDRRGFDSAGAVQLIYGTSSGLGTNHAELLDQNSPTVGDAVEAEDGFGSSLAPRGSSLGVRALP